MTFDPIGRARRWNQRWRRIVPILVAEFMALVGFGALLPVLPLYIVEQGVDPVTLGMILAAWPAARLFFEPVFGWLADRTSRRALMLGGLVVLTGAFDEIAVALIGYDAVRFRSPAYPGDVVHAELRMELGVPVPGLVVRATRPACARQASASLVPIAGNGCAASSPSRLNTTSNAGMRRSPTSARVE